MALVSSCQFIPNKGSSDTDWITWYQMIPGGKSVANPIWLKAWGMYGSDAANTINLQNQMKSLAGITIATTGIAQSIESDVLSIGDKIESVAMLPIEIFVGGGIAILAIFLFIIYKAFENPEGTEELIESGAKIAAMQDGGVASIAEQNKYWILGGGFALIAATIAFMLYYRNQSQADVNCVLAALTPAAGTTAADPILNKASAASTGTLTDLGNSQIFNPNYWQSNPGAVTISAVGSDGSLTGAAEQYAQTIYNASNFPSDPASVVNVFKQLKSKADVSKLADVFAGYMNSQGESDNSLWDFINRDWMTGGCGPTQDTCYLGLRTNYLKQVYNWVTNQLT